MDQPFKQKSPGKPRILVAPLDWGLGHTTRCIPVIRELLARGCEVYLAGNRGQATLLSPEFPGLPILSLEGYNIRYARSARGLIRALLFQLPKLLRSIRHERAWLREACQKHQFDAVISDNRYGLYHPGLPSIFITHQLTIKTGITWTEKLLRKKNYRYISRFSACWVPDHQGAGSLAGELSHPPFSPGIPVRYLGPLSRFNITSTAEQPGHLLVILSGPEPQRTMFEDRIIKDIGHYNGTATIVRGLPGAASCIPSTGMLHFFNHLSAAELNGEMMRAEFVIGRCGYSTIMDISALRKKSILVPTPGQTEQEYLGKYLAGKQMIACLAQKDFTLGKALELARNMDYLLPQAGDSHMLKDAVAELMVQVSGTALG